MKIRTGFVSNSSSSSFAIAKKSLTSKQLDQIRNHPEVAAEMGMSSSDERWDIQETDDIIGGSTWMDNFSMNQFLQKIGVPSGLVEWNDSAWFSPEDFSGMMDCMEEDLTDKLTDKLVEYLTSKMSQFQVWERAEIRAIVKKVVCFEDD